MRRRQREQWRRGGTVGCGSVDVDLAQLDRIDGAGAVLLARLLDRLDADGRHASVIEGANGEAARLIARYRERRTDLPAPRTRAMSLLTRIGALAAHLPGSCLHSAAFDPGWRRAGPRRRFGATTVITHMTARAYVEATLNTRRRGRCAIT